MKSPELREVARKLASLAMTKSKQGGKLKIRQREQLRRAFAAAAEPLGWDVIVGRSGDPVAKATADVEKLAVAGARSIEKDLADELAGKKTELTQLKKVASSLGKLADDPKAEYPTEIEYSHTARDGSRGLVTKTETLTLADPSEAQAAVATFEKSLDRWEKMRDEMIEELKRKQRQVEETKEELPDFANSSKRLLGEVLATL